MSDTVEVPTSFESPESAMIESARYDPDTLTLEVTLRPNKVYTYHQVRADLWEGFVNAPSKGKYFVANIRPMYVGRRK